MQIAFACGGEADAREGSIRLQEATPMFHGRSEFLSESARARSLEGSLAQLA